MVKITVKSLELKCSLPTVRKWVQRLSHDPRIETLNDASRGRPLKIPAIVKCEIMKTACSPPPTQEGMWDSVWTLKNLSMLCREVDRC